MISSLLPPTPVVGQSMMYVSQESIYALYVRDGSLSHTYPVQGFIMVTVTDDILYASVNRHPDYQILAFHRATGHQMWSYALHTRLPAAPAIANNRAYISVDEGIIHALDATTGKLVWRSQIPLDPTIPPFLRPLSVASPVISEGTVFLAPVVNDPSQAFVYAFQESDGKALWQARLPEPPSHALTAFDHVLYLGTSSRCLALRPDDGSIIWQAQVEGRPSSPPVLSEGLIYLACSEFNDKSSLYALHAQDGSLLWKYNLLAGSPTIPAALAGTVCIGSGDGSLHALRATDGTLRWKAQTQGRFLSTPAIADDRVYVGASDGYLYAFHLESGQPAWTTFIPGKLQARAQTTMLQPDLHFEIIPPEQEPEA